MMKDFFRNIECFINNSVICKIYKLDISLKIGFVEAQQVLLRNYSIYLVIFTDLSAVVQK